MNRINSNYAASYCGAISSDHQRDDFRHNMPLMYDTTFTSSEGRARAAGMMMRMRARASASEAMERTTQAQGMNNRFDDDAPLVTPTVNTRMSLSKAFMRNNNNSRMMMSTKPPPLRRERQQQQSFHHPISASPSEKNSPSPQNPLDLLSSVSAHVSNKENDNEKEPRSNNNNNSHYQSESSYAGGRNAAGQRHGRGIMKYPNGCHYSGCFANDKRHGYGECWYPNGCIYAGFWNAGKRDGVGKMIYADRGDMYEGEWLQDRRHGRGIYYRADGRADVAQYRNHHVVGQGVQWSPNREYVVRLENGRSCGRISVREALGACDRIGMPGVPKKEMTFRDEVIDLCSGHDET